MPEERKLVSILFADVVGSTALGAEHDPEVVRVVMSRFFDEMQRIARIYRGTVDKFIGDAVMVVFGVPRLHDDDAERAVRAALAMRDAAVELSRETPFQLTVRVGVNSGEVVVGMGPDGRLLLVGDAVNLAARLQQTADSGEVAVGSLTEQLTRAAIVYRERTDVAVKGRREPIPAYRALRPRTTVPTQLRGLPSMRAPLIGRERELSLLLDTFSRVAEERRAHLFTILGPAGVGKSRLVVEAFERIRRDTSARILQGRCLPYGEGITYWPFIEILREDMGIADADDHDTALLRLNRRIDGLTILESERRPVLARLAVLLGLDLPARALGDTPPERVGPELAWGLRRYLMASRDPVVLLVDDMQWAERELVELVHQLADRITASPLLLICLARPELLEAHPSWGLGGRNATLITLDALNRVETARLLSELLKSDALPESLRDQIVDRSEGNPLYCEEFLRVLIDELRLVRVDDRWLTVGAKTDVRVPESIQALLAARLDGLPAAEKRALQAASVVGERFNSRQVQALVDDGGVEGALDEAMRKELVVEDARAADPAALRFKHLLIRDVAYASLRKDERARLHDRFLAYLRTVIGDRRQEFTEILAYHAERAFAITDELRLGGELLRDRAARALEAALVMGELAMSRENLAAVKAAIDTASAAARALGDLGGTVSEARLALIQAEDASRSEQLTVAREAWRRAASLALRADRLDLAAVAHLSAARIERVFRDGAAVVREGQEAARLYRTVGDAGGELEAEWTCAFPLHLGGQLVAFIERGRELSDRALKLGERARAASILAWIAQDAGYAGRPAEAEAFAHEAAALASELGLRTAAFRAEHATAILARHRGDLVAAEAAWRRSIAAAEEAAQEWDVMSGQYFLAEILIELGRLEEADALLEGAIRTSERIEEHWQRAGMLENRARIALARGDPRGAEALVHRAVAVAIPQDNYCQIENYRTLARTLASLGRDSEAEAAFQRALATSRLTDFGFLTADVSLAYARFLANRGRNAEAAALVDDAETWLEARGYEVRRQEVASLRESLSLEPSGPTT